MKLSTKGRYAVMAMVDLAARQNAGAVALSAIAERQNISLSYLEQLFARLRRAGVVKSVRGPGGGYVLARPMAETTVADIVVAVDEPLRATRCHAAGKGCMPNGEQCLTHDLWDALSHNIHDFLARVTLDDIVHRRVTPQAAGRTAADVAAVVEVA